MTQHPSSSRNQSRGGLALRPGMTASLICGLREGSSDPFPPLWRFQDSQRPLPCAMMIMSVDLVGKTRQQPRQGSLLRPRPIGRDRVVLSRGQACRCYACACVGSGAHELCETFASAVCPTCTRNLLFGKLDALVGAAIGDFGVQMGRLKTLNHRVPGSSPGAPTKPFKSLAAFTV